MTGNHDIDTRIVGLRGPALLRDATLNKGTAFTEEERLAFGLEGLLPHQILTLEQQKDRIIANFRNQATPLDKYIYLRSLQDRNETLFFSSLIDNLTEMMPIVYTPTVGQAVEQFSHIYNTSRGLYITPEDVDRMDMIFQHSPCKYPAVIVATDNEGILGIGDQGTGGMAIPIGKLALYVAGAGFRPEQCLPVCLDVGTDNETLLNDPLYLGVREPRLRGDDYDRLIEAFVNAVHRYFPRAVLQWEDFSRDIAFENLVKYRERHLSFNDDIQGTAAVTSASLMGAARLANRPFTEERVCILGAGSAGVGVALGIITALVRAGLDPQEARTRVMLFDSKGLLVDDRTDLAEYKMQVTMPADKVKDWAGRSIYDVITETRPTALIGLSGRPGTIDEKAAMMMAQCTERPAIFPMSNPTKNAEATPEQILNWTNGKAIIATGSPFDPVEYNGKVYEFSQANNVYVFPGIGFGTYLCQSQIVSDNMLASAAECLAKQTTEEDLACGRVLPQVNNLREISRKVAAEVITAAIEDGITHEHIEGDIEEMVGRHMYIPHYAKYIPVL